MSNSPNDYLCKAIRITLCCSLSHITEKETQRALSCSHSVWYLKLLNLQPVFQSLMCQFSCSFQKSREESLWVMKTTDHRTCRWIQCLFGKQGAEGCMTNVHRLWLGSKHQLACVSAICCYQHHARKIQCWWMYHNLINTHIRDSYKIDIPLCFFFL
jgi:hypothetical protein